MVRIIRQVVVAVATGGATFLLSYLLDGETTWTTMLSVFIGGVVLTAQHLVDVENGVEAVGRRLDRVDRGVRLLESLENSAVEVAVPGARPVSGLVERAAKLVPPAPVLGRLVAEEIRALNELLRGLEGDSVTCQGEDRDWILALTRGTRHTISATSTTAADGGRRSFSDGFWKSELGRAYLAAQQEAVARGVLVRRVFILNNEKVRRNADFIKICDDQRKAGIVVHSVVVPGGDQLGGGTGWRKTFRDFILFDDEVSYEVEVGALQGASITSTHLKFDRTRIGERIALFNEIWAEARAAEAGAGDAAGPAAS
ncbi:hypothetical protein [Parafrankia discariae]|uniref:hypothetical protein n=1 Tax=Parafrankia discariae TaxID=365528 RepID=UPI00037C1153|nr:hypothetical protein [Parafrankia discariae]